MAGVPMPVELQMQLIWDLMRQGQVQRAPSPIPDDPIHPPQRTPPPPPAVFQPPNRHRHRQRLPVDSRGEPMRKRARLEQENIVGNRSEDQEMVDIEAGPSEVNHNQVDNRRPLEPMELVGYSEVSPSFAHGAHGPGDFFAKSHTKYLGPFKTPPTAEQLPANDNYVIIQKRGQHPETNKSLFIKVGSILT